MARTAADILLDVLRDWGVEVVFGLPGDGVNGLMAALRKRRDEIRFIQVRHEAAAAFMACGYAKYTGRLGVCLATSGPGGLNLLTGLYDAKMDGQPVLALTGHRFHDLIDTQAQQDVDLDRVLTDVSFYSMRIMGVAHVEAVTHRACRTALSRRGVAHLTLPADIQEQTADQRSTRNVLGHARTEVLARDAGVPQEVDIAGAAEVLNVGRRVAILAGRGALGAGAELEATAERLAAPIVKALLGKAVVPDDSPYTTGGLGLLGTEPSQEVMEGCDTLLMVGTGFPYIEYLPKPGQARVVQIDRDPACLGLREPVEVGLVGDSARTLQALLPHLAPKTDRAFLQAAQEGARRWWRLMEERGTRRDRPMKPQVVAWELGRRLDERAIVSADSGTITTWWAWQIPVKRGQMHSVSGTLASMACGLPYAIGAQIAYPDRQSIAFVGDGGFSMLMAEFATCVKYELPVKVIVVKNDTLGQIKWEQMAFLGHPEYGCDLQPIDFAAFARACGGTGLTVDDPASCGDVLEQALATPGPVLVEAVVDPLEPPMPAKVTLGQATKFARALARGTPSRARVALEVVAGRMRKLLAGRWERHEKGGRDATSRRS